MLRRGAPETTTRTGTSMRLALASLAMLGGSFGFAAASGCSSEFTHDVYADGGGSQGDGAASGDDGGTIITSSSDGIVGTACASKTCKDQNVACGASTDGCGNALDCGGCYGANQACDGGACSCVPKTCDAQRCGFIDDGCGNMAPCGGSCASGTTCGPDNTCVAACTVMAAAACGAEVTDGCGNEVPGLSCASGTTCGGNGDAGACGCHPLTCQQAGAECGSSVDDGCGGTQSCGACTKVPGTCVAQHCQSCIPVSDPGLGFEAQCGKTALPHAWACGCTGANCNAPDTASGTAPSCALLTKTSEHAVYCCTNDGGGG